MNYYKKELKKLKAEKAQFPLKMKLFSEHGETFTLDLNLESVQVLRQFLDQNFGEDKYCHKCGCTEFLCGHNKRG